MLLTSFHQNEHKVKGKVSSSAIQTKLRIGASNDMYEQEADAVADQVMKMPASQIPPIQRKCTDCEEEEALQMKPLAASITPIIQKQEEEEEMLQMKGLGNQLESTSDLESNLQRTKGGGQPLSEATQSFMNRSIGANFGNVKVHTNTTAIQMNRQLNAKAFTNGSNIYFNQGQYNPQSTEGKHLLAHELTHVVQQGDSVIRRAIDPSQLPSTSVSAIMADDTYFENNITNIQFFSAELAILHYGDGSQIRLGLVPDHLDSSVPIAGVDYISPASRHIRTSMNPTGTMSFMPRGQDTLTSIPPNTPFGDVVRDYSQQITFSHDPGSGRIVPSIVNQLTAPRLSRVLLQARDEYTRNFDAMASGMVEILEQLEIIVILASLLPSGGSSVAAGGGRAATARGAAAVGSGVLARASSRLARVFTRLLRTGSTEAMVVVEGVEFHTIRVAMEGTELVITRFGIRNAGRVAGQGRLMHAAYEQAAIAAARQAGARTVAVRTEMIVNQTWRTYLESQGYAARFFASGSGGSRLWVKIFTL